MSKPLKIFLDVGAHKGETLQIALEGKYGFDKLFCFEPVSECCDSIRASYKDPRVTVFEFGLWNEDCTMPLYSPGDGGASVFKDKPNRHADISRDVKFVRASSWFSQNLKDDDQVYLKLNCEGAECTILDDLIESGEYKKINVAMIDFDVRKIPSQRHLMSEMKAKLNQLDIPKIFYIDEYDPGKGSHNSFTHFWLDNSQKMKIIDGLKLKGRPAEIPDCSRDDLPQFFVEMGFKAGAEIGVKKGEFSEQFAKAGLTIYAVDPWLSYKEYSEPDGQKWFDSLYDQTKKRLAPYPNAKIIRKTSLEAARDFEDESLDFVYIDGNHQLQYVIDDIAVWSNKIKPGGIICGHDYIYTDPRTLAGICHVIYAVQAYTQAYKINNWYLLGRKQRLEGEIRDRFRSWMWIKKDYQFKK